MKKINSQEYIEKTIGINKIVELARLQYPKLGRGAVILQFHKNKEEVSFRYIPWTYIKEIGFDKLVPGFDVDKNTKMIFEYEPLYQAYLIVLSEYEQCAYSVIIAARDISTNSDTLT